VSTRIRRILTALAVLSGFAGLLALSLGDGRRAVEVELARAQRAPLADTLLASGNLAYTEQIQLRPELTGRVAQVLVEEGDTVRAGQLLLVLDQVPFVAQMQSAEAGVRSARLTVGRLRTLDANLRARVQRREQLLAQRLVSLDDYTQLQSEQAAAALQVAEAEQALAQQQAALDQARDQLQRSQFHAPITGKVVSVDIKAGETVIAGTTNIIGSDLMTLADTSSLLAELRVDEADLGRLRIGQPVQVYAASAPTQAIAGTVVRIASLARKLDSTEGLALRVRVRLQPVAAVRLAPGMSCRAEIIAAEGAASINVPVAAVREDGRGQHVWTVDAQSRAKRVAVVAGAANDTEQALLQGLHEGNEVISGPGRVLAQLHEGQPVRVAMPLTAQGGAGP
jgi:HlyD family secretion protein